MALIIEAKGADFVNKGGELMLLALINQLDASGLSYKLVIEPNRAARYESIAAIGAHLKLPFRIKGIDLSRLAYLIPKSFRAYLQQNYGVFLEPDIGAILDISGFAYGAQWPSRALRYLCREIKRLSQDGRKVILLPQAFGPFDNRKDIELVKRYFPVADLVYPRDKTSYDCVTKLCGERRSIAQKPDFTNLITVSDENYESIKLPESAFIIIPNYNMLAEHSTETKWHARYLDTIVTVANLAKQESMVPILLNHEGEKDQLICEQIRDALKFNIDILNFDSALEIKAAISQAQALFCSRFHGCVSALSQGKACLGTSWSHKYEELYAEYGVSEFLLKPDYSKEELHTLIASVSNGETGEKLRLRSEAIRNTSRAMWDQVISELKRLDC